MVLTAAHQRLVFKGEKAMTEKNISTISEPMQYSYMIDDPIKRAKRWIEETEEWQKALSAEETAHAETKALLAEEREKFKMLIETVYEFVRNNARMNGKKVASDLGTDGAESKEFEDYWMTAREWCLEHQLPVNVNEPKWIVSDRLTDICITFPEKEQWRLDSVGTRWFPKWACDILDRMYEKDDTFLSEYRTE